MFTEHWVTAEPDPQEQRLKTLQDARSWAERDLTLLKELFKWSYDLETFAHYLDLFLQDRWYLETTYQDAITRAAVERTPLPRPVVVAAREHFRKAEALTTRARFEALWAESEAQGRRQEQQGPTRHWLVRLLLPLVFRP